MARGESTSLPTFIHKAPISMTVKTFKTFLEGKKITASITGLHDPLHVTPIQDSFLPPSTNFSQEAAVEDIMHISTYDNS